MAAATWAVLHRPQTFSDVAGQAHIAPVLRRMVEKAHEPDGGFPPALVLFGSRGTGKTTLGRILSKALNCTAPVGGEPCNACPTCIAITSGRSAGVEEIDMATHGSVEGIRQLQSSAEFSLAEDWRIYIMDEVHSASKEAFNALLKTLEEPPPRTIFLLLTTEPDRIPDTIRSRAMEFEFRRIPTGVIVERLRMIAGEQGQADRIDLEVYGLLANRARGGMRDAVMGLEQVCYREGQITAATVGEVFGISDLAQRSLDAALKGDLRRGHGIIVEALASGAPPVPLIEQMIDGLLAIIAASAGAPVDPAGPVEPAWVASYAGTPNQKLLEGMRVAWDARGRMSAGSSSAGATLAAGYALMVTALAPSVRPVAAVPVPARLGPPASPPAPQALRRPLTAAQLALIVAEGAARPITVSEALAVLERPSA